MTRTHTRIVLALAGVFVGLVAPAAAGAQKPGGGTNAQSASKVGDNLADLISGNLTQLLVVFVGASAIAALFARSIGQAVLVIVAGLLAGVFIFDPTNAVDLFQGIYNEIL